MNTVQEDKHSMHLASQRSLDDNIDKMRGFVKFTDLKTGVDSNLTATGAIIGEQEKDRSGVATNKNVLRERMIDLTMRVSTCLVSYATIEKKPELLAEAKITESDLRKEADTKVKEKAELINRLGNENQPKLADYGLIASDLTDLPVAIAAYFAAIPEPKLTRGERVRLTAQLAELQKSTDTYFKSIDTMVTILEKREPEFFTEYFNARKINRTGKRIRAAEILVKNAASGEPMAKVKVTVTSKNKTGTDLTKTVKRTSSNGMNYLQHLGAGDYDCVAEFGGFVTTNVTFVQNDGITTKLVIEMQPSLTVPA